MDDVAQTLHGVQLKNGFKVDTGADVTVIPETAYKYERDGYLVPSNLPLSGPTGETLEVCGKFSGSLTWKGVESQQDIYIIHHLRTALLRQAGHRSTQRCGLSGANTGTGHRKTVSTSVQRAEQELHYQVQRKRYTFCLDYPKESTHTAAT